MTTLPHPAPGAVGALGRPPRGRLTIFFGMAPGVGKTFAMLTDARARLARGERIVVGDVFTHGRPETEALLDGLPRLHEGQQTDSTAIFDIDAAKKAPCDALLLDELAYANPRGARFKKRWQDVEALLEAGIHVHTTLNVQHVESLASVVEQVTGVRVVETVPDRLLAQAASVTLVDVPPDALLARLAAGHVYRRGRAAEASENFFKKGNLLALRELALRAVADRVDADLTHFRDLHKIEAAWPVTERLLVCVSPSPHAAALVRAGARAAASLRAPLVCAFVGTGLPLQPAAERRLAAHFELAERLGAELVRLEGEDPVETLVQFAQKRSVTKILVGKPTHSALRDRFQPPFVERLVRASGEIAVWVLPPLRLRSTEPAGDFLGPRRSSGKARALRWAVALLVPTLATALGKIAFGTHERADVVMVYLFGVVLVALRFGQTASLLAAALSVLAYDLFFVPPLYTLAVADLRHIVTFFVLFFVASTIARLVGRVRRQKRAAEQREAFTRVLYDASRALSEAADARAIRAIAATLPREADVDAVAVVTVEDDDATAPQVPCPCGPAVSRDASVSKFAGGRERAGPEVEGESALLEGLGQEAVRLCQEERRVVGRFTGTLAEAPIVAFPLLAKGSVHGALLLRPRPGSEALRDPSERARIEALARLVGDSLGRLALRKKLARAEVAVETEQIKARILSSVSHDLRTPLAVIVGASETLASDEVSRQDGVVRELARSVGSEAERLSRLVTNLLSLTRLESGTLDLKRELIPLDEVLAPVLARVEARNAGETPFHVALEIPIDIPLIRGDPVLLEQLFENLLDNARRYAPGDVALRAEQLPQGKTEAPTLSIAISDRGPGVPVGRRATLFEPLARADAGNGGLGLGLSICRGIARAHGGDLTWEDRPGGGTVFRVRLPGAAVEAYSEQEEV